MNCIVCKNELEDDAYCSRCGTNNRAWRLWKKHELIEQEGLRGLLAFTEPHFHLPFLITALSTFFGLLFTFTLWGDIKPGFHVLVALVTPVGCLLSLQGVYERRLSIRRRELLRQVKRGWSKGPGISTLTVSIPAVALGLVLAFTLVLVKVDILWELVAWLALIEAPEAGGTFPEKLQAVMPFTSLIAYPALAPSFTASSALMLAWQYINQLNEFLPVPIFLNTELLVRVIKSRAAEIFDIEVKNIAWDQFRRTRTGGARLTARLPVADSMIRPPAFSIRSDPWGRIQDISEDPLQAEAEQAALIQRVQAKPEEVKPIWDLARNTLQLYFEHNLRQGRYIFWLSVGVMSVGFVFILCSISRAFAQPDSITLALLGGVAGVITEFIGATFLFIYRSTARQSVSYMKTVEQINTVGMAVQIINSISEEESGLQNKVRAELGKMVVSSQGETERKSKASSEGNPSD